MKPVKRIEIIIDSLDLKALLTELETLGVSGYSVMKDVIGSGDRGERSGDLLNDTMNNCYILIACDETEVEKITTMLKPSLKRYGGVCLVSDAQWLLH